MSEANYDEVICPNCVTQFRAIPAGGYNPALTDALNRAIAMLEADKREIEAMERQVEILSDELSKCRKQAQAVEPIAWVFLPNRELLWPSEVEATNPISIDDYKPLYAHPAGEHVPEAAFGNIEPVMYMEEQPDGTLIEVEPWVAQQVAVPCPSLCELCIKRGYTACANVAKTTPLPAPSEQQVAVPAGMALVPTEALLDIKARVNTLATLSLKAERYSVGREIKQDIADMLAVAQGAKP